MKSSVLLSLLLVAAVFVSSCVAAPASAWRDRVIYQILTDRFFPSTSSSSPPPCPVLSRYCGGTFDGISNHLLYLKNLGVTAIWISPVTAQYSGLVGNVDSYHGYWTVDFTKLNDKFGGEAGLRHLVTEAHNMGMYVMVDVVANHVGPVDMDFSSVVPFDNASYYHNKCEITNWGNQQMVETCRLQNLPDLDQSVDFVKNSLYNWIENLVKDYNFDGVRVDTVPEIHADFWDGFNKAAGVYCLGEVFNGDLDYVSSYQHHMDGLFSYPLFFALRNVFINPSTSMQGSLEGLLGPNGQWWSKFKDVSLMGNFLDNHDNPRFLHEKFDYTLYKNAIAFTLLMKGIPVIYYGTEQGYAGGADPDNREPLWTNLNENHELYKFIATILKHRSSSSLFSTEQVQRYAASNIYSYSRGDTVLCTTNAGGSSSVSFDLTYLPSGWKEGVKVCNILASNDCAFVTSGKVHVELSNGLPKIYAPEAQLVQ